MGSGKKGRVEMDGEWKERVKGMRENGKLGDVLSANTFDNMIGRKGKKTKERVGRTEQTSPRRGIKQQNRQTIANKAKEKYSYFIFQLIPLWLREVD